MRLNQVDYGYASLFVPLTRDKLKELFPTNLRSWVHNSDGQHLRLISVDTSQSNPSQLHNWPDEVSFIKGHQSTQHRGNILL